LGYLSGLIRAETSVAMMQPDLWWNERGVSEGSFVRYETDLMVETTNIAGDEDGDGIGDLSEVNVFISYGKIEASLYFSVFFSSKYRITRAWFDLVLGNQYLLSK
jgi:hypothetical protein